MVYDASYIKDSSLIILKKTPFKIISWITVLLVSVILFTMFSLFFNYSYYFKYPAIYDNNLKITMDLKDLIKLKDYKLLINKTFYDFKIEEVNEINNYYEVILDVNLDVSDKYVNVYFKSKPTTIFREFMKKIRKEWLYDSYQRRINKY